MARLNPIQFNILLGLTTLVGFLMTGPSSFTSMPMWLMVCLALFLYITEYWAFLFKLKFSRAKYLFELSKGNPSAKVGETINPGCMLFYAFLMRMIFRIVLGMVVIMGIGGSLTEDMNGVQIGFMIANVLFELFNMLYSMYESHIFKNTPEDEEEYTDDYWENEKKWRSKMFPKLKDPKETRKEIVSTVILLLMAIATTKLFWDGINAGFVDFIIRTDKYHESVSFAVIVVLVSCFVLCLFFLMPVRLAFWIEEKMHADTPKERLRYKLSLLFAGIAVCTPSIIQLIKSFLM